MRRKVLHISIIFTGILLAGCGSQSSGKMESSKVQVIETVANIETSADDVNATDSGEEITKCIVSQGDSETENETKSEQHPRMVKLDDKIYIDTGEISNLLRCGVMDFSLNSSVKEGVPTKNNQTNFGKGYEGQYGMRENRIEIYIDGTWHIFAHNENNFEGVGMKVVENTNQSLTLNIYHDTDLQVEYGEDFLLEKWDEDSKCWIAVKYKNTDFAFKAVAICAPKGKVSEWRVNWDYIYGKLEKGKYRIVKDFIDYKEAGKNNFYTLMAEFECE